MDHSEAVKVVEKALSSGGLSITHIATSIYGDDIHVTVTVRLDARPKLDESAMAEVSVS